MSAAGHNYPFAASNVQNAVQAVTGSRNVMPTYRQSTSVSRGDNRYQFSTALQQNHGMPSSQTLVQAGESTPVSSSLQFIHNHLNAHSISSSFSNSHLTNTEQQKTSSTSMTAVTSQPHEIIDLTELPSSPVQQQNFLKTGSSMPAMTSNLNIVQIPEFYDVPYTISTALHQNHGMPLQPLVQTGKSTLASNSASCSNNCLTTQQRIVSSSSMPPALTTYTLKIIEIPEPYDVPYKVHEVTILGKRINCINAEPFTHFRSDLLVTLDDLVQALFPICNVWRCAYILNIHLKTPLYTGNSEQIALLRDSGLLRLRPNESIFPNASIKPDESIWPMATVENVQKVLLQLKAQITQYYQ